jgi:hypothetical protein
MQRSEEPKRHFIFFAEKHIHCYFFTKSQHIFSRHHEALNDFWSNNDAGKTEERSWHEEITMLGLVRREASSVLHHALRKIISVFWKIMMPSSALEK